MAAIAIMSLTALTISADPDLSAAATAVEAPAADGVGPLGPETALETALDESTSNAALTTGDLVALSGSGGAITWLDPDVGRRALEAIELIGYPWQERLPGWSIRFHAAEEGAYGYTLTQESIIDVYVRNDQSIELLAHVIAHELGHAVDVSLNDGNDRRRWQSTRDIEDAPWWPNSRAADFATGAGDFAESFAAWQVGPSSFRSELGSIPTPEQEMVLAELAAA